MLSTSIQVLMPEPATWSHECDVTLVTLAYMEWWMVVNKTNFSRTDGLPYCLTHGAPREALLLTVSLCTYNILPVSI